MLTIQTVAFYTSAGSTSSISSYFSFESCCLLWNKLKYELINCVRPSFIEQNKESNNTYASILNHFH